MRAPWLVLACAVAGCQTSGAVQLTLDLPTAADLAPTGMTTITVVAVGSDGDPTSTTSVIDGNGDFTAGDVPVADGVQLDVLLRDVSGRLVGVGEAAKPANISGTTTTHVEIPVRRPFVYAATASSLLSFDPTLDARDPAFQGAVAGVSAPMFAISAGGDRLAVVSAMSVQAIDTSTNALVGKPIALPGAASDAAAVPGTHQVAVAFSSGIAIVDLDSGNVATTSGKDAVDRVTVGADGNGVMTAYGLVGRVAAPVSPFDTCTGTSSIVMVPVDAPGNFQAISVTDGLSDLAADPSAGLLFATAPCVGQVEQIDATGSATDVADLERAAEVSVLGGRVWAAGSHTSVPECFKPASGNGSNESVTCTASSDENCPPNDNTENFVGFVGSGAYLIVDSIPTQGGSAADTTTFDVPARRETIVNTDDDAQQTAEVIKAFDIDPIDLVVLPGGQYVSVVVNSSYFIQQEGDDFGIVLPCQKATTSDWLLVDMTDASIADRVRTQCNLMTGPSQDEFMDWKCDDPSPEETSTQGDYQPLSVGALFGAR